MIASDGGGLIVDSWTSKQRPIRWPKGQRFKRMVWGGWTDDISSPNSTLVKEIIASVQLRQETMSLDEMGVEAAAMASDGN